MTENVMAKESGDWLVRVGASSYHPKGKNGGFDNPSLPGTEMELDVEHGVGFEMSVTRMFTDHWALEFMATAPTEHDLKYEHGKTLEGLGWVGSVDRTTLMLNAQYHFNPAGRFQPYLGAGVQYSFFSGEKAFGPLEGSTLRLNDSIGPGIQVGLDAFLSERVFLNVDFRYLGMDSKLKVDGIKITDVELTPFAWALHVGYLF